jgi:hypothetical protein
MVKCGVLFEVWTEFLNNMQTSFIFKGLKMIYFAYFHSVMEYGIAFWGGAAESKRVFHQQKRIIRIMTGSNSRTSCKPLFRSLVILTLPSKYILSLMKLLLQNMANYIYNFTVHGINTRNKLQLYKPASNLALYHREVFL